MSVTATPAKDQDRLLQRCQSSRGIPGAIIRLSRLHVSVEIGDWPKPKRFVSFIPAVSDKAAKRIRLEVRRWRLHLRSDLELEEIARWTRPFLSGWVRYYGRFYPSKLREELRTIDAFIVRWVSRKYKRFRGHTLAAWDWLRSLKGRNPTMFAHWTLGPAAG
jgi:RNA-directed DNA polymerase